MAARSQYVLVGTHQKHNTTFKMALIPSESSRQEQNERTDSREIPAPFWKRIRTSTRQLKVGTIPRVVQPRIPRPARARRQGLDTLGAKHPIARPIHTRRVRHGTRRAGVHNHAEAPLVPHRHVVGRLEGEGRGLGLLGLIINAAVVRVRQRDVRCHTCRECPARDRHGAVARVGRDVVARDGEGARGIGAAGGGCEFVRGDAVGPREGGKIAGHGGARVRGVGVCGGRWAEEERHQEGRGRSPTGLHHVRYFPSKEKETKMR